MHRLLPALLSLLITVSAFAQEESFSTAIVPIAGAVTGIGGVRWSTDIELRNPFGESVTVALLLANNPDEQFQVLTLESGQSVVINDVIRETFGLDEVLTPLIVRTAGRRSVTVNATVRGVGAEGEVRPQQERILYSELLPTRTFLTPLEMNADFRTNIGLGNIGDGAVRVTVALRRVTGRDLATTTVVIPPRTLTQVSLASLFPAVVRSENLSLVCEFYGTSGYAYASVLKNATHDGTLYGP